MIEKEKLEAVAIDFADEVKLNANPLEEQINKMNKTFTNVTNNGVGEFDTTMLTTTIKAKKEGSTTPETRLITSERDIEIQMDIGITDGTDDSGERSVFFKENFFSEAGNTIYNRCPDNLIEFLNDYFTKYRRYPTINVNVSTYDDFGTITQTVQSPLRTVYKTGKRPMMNITDQLIKGMGQTEFKINVATKYKFIHQEGRADMLITSPSMYFVKGEQGKSGKFVVVSTGTATVVPKNSFDLTFDTTYEWGYIDPNSTGVGYTDWVADGRIGTLKVTTAEEVAQTIGMTRAEGIEGFKCEVITIAGNTADTGDYLYSIDGYFNEVIGQSISLGESNNSEVDNIMRFKFNFSVTKEEPQPKFDSNIQIALFDDTYKVDSETGAISDRAFIRMGEDKKSALAMIYMYFDPSLHLPEIYFPEETTEE